MERRLPKKTLLCLLAVFGSVSSYAAHYTSGRQISSSATSISLHATRQSPSDLEITGMVSGLAQGSIGYITYRDLKTLPQVTVTVSDDLNFPGETISVTGIYLDVLAHALSALPASDLIDTLCTDHYRGHFPATYIAAHKPIFALKINGERAGKWAAQTHQEDPGPYFITYSHFVSVFRVLSHEDKPQLPINITRLNFTATALTFAAIAPHGNFPPDSPVQQGFTIAKQNCLRCHNQGPYGGTKAGRDWNSLSTWAREQPDFFAAYIHNAKSIEPHTHMPANLEYDATTLNALTAYFQTFTQGASTKSTAHGPSQESTPK
jgi:hypothetical protein